MHQRMPSECLEPGARSLLAALFVLLLLGLGAVTCLIPSRRAARLDPATQLEA
jgi:ABC-type lipoprotein release transport system permease subunit